MLFHDRAEAGQKLAQALKKFDGRPDLVIVALPRGGVVLGRVVADALGAPLDVVVPRKIGAAGNEEYAIGALTETGQAVWNEAEKAEADPNYLKLTVAREQAEARRRLDLYRAGRPPRDLKDKMVVIVDDGIATGYTIRAAIETVRAEEAAQVIVAVPVAPPDVAARIAADVDEVVTLARPELFFAIGAFYSEFGQVDDATVIRLMRPHHGKSH